jgi:hypothetical protein
MVVARLTLLTTTATGFAGSLHVDDGDPITGRFQFHEPLKDPDCDIQWTGVWQVSAGAR